MDVILNGLRWLGLDWDEGPLTGDATGPSKGDLWPAIFNRSARKLSAPRRSPALARPRLRTRRRSEIQDAARASPPFMICVISDVVRPLTDREELDPDFVIMPISDG